MRGPDLTDRERQAVDHDVPSFILDAAARWHKQLALISSRPTPA
jgi:hypothetical protein